MLNSIYYNQNIGLYNDTTTTPVFQLAQRLPKA